MDQDQTGREEQKQKVIQEGFHILHCRIHSNNWLNAKSERITNMINMYLGANAVNVAERQLECIIRNQAKNSVFENEDFKWVSALITTVLNLQLHAAYDGYQFVLNQMIKPVNLLEKAKEKSSENLIKFRSEIQSYLTKQFEKSPDHSLTLDEWFPVSATITDLLHEQEANIRENYEEFINEWVSSPTLVKKSARFSRDIFQIG